MQEGQSSEARDQRPEVRTGVCPRITRIDANVRHTLSALAAYLFAPCLFPLQNPGIPVICMALTMKARPDCLLCLFNQALNTVRGVTDDAKVHERVLREVARVVARETLNQTPTALSQHVYRIVSRVTGIRDPYRRQKAETNRIALRLLPELRGLVARSPDSLDAALHAAVAGNIIDIGIGHAFDLQRDVRRLMKEPFAVSAIAAFRRDLRPGRRLLYLGDNAGEIVLDTLLVEQIRARGVDVTYSVKSGPIINDATRRDARVAGMDRLATIIETGSDNIGVHWGHVSPAFRKAFRQADVVVAKGHGNFETCDDRRGNTYFLLKAKCRIVAAALGVELGDLVFAHGQRGKG